MQLAGSRIVASLCLLFAATVAVPVLSAGCGSAADTFCAAQCQCTGCSTVAQDSCSQTYNTDVSEASSVGCGSEANDYFSCLNLKAECNGTTYDTAGCENERQKATNCVLSAHCTIGVSSDFLLTVACAGG